MKIDIDHHDELLPWYVNDTLTDEERREVEEHLKGCDRCRKEVVYLKTLRSQVKETGKVELYGELGLKRLLRDVKKEGKPLRRRFSFPWWQPALAIAATLVIVVQGIILYNLSQQHEPITTLSAPVEEGLFLQVRFAPDATEEQIREVLQSVEGSIIDGPGALGIYRVSLDLPPEEEERINDIVAILESHPYVVTHVARE